MNEIEWTNYVKMCDTICRIDNDTRVSTIDTSEFDLTKMHAKVSYDDWVVCHYLEDDNLYLFKFDTDSINKVEVVGGFKYNEDFKAVDSDGNVLDESQLLETRLLYYNDCTVCGETDDMSAYVYFK